MKFHQQPPIPAYEDWIRFMRILSEPELYAEAAESLEEKRREINESIAGRERLSQLDVLEAQAKADRTSAATQLRTATIEAERLVAEAKSNARSIYEREELVRVEAMRAVQAAQSEAEERKAALTVRENDLAEAERQCNARLAEARKVYTEGAALKEEYEARISALKQAMG